MNSIHRKCVTSYVFQVYIRYIFQVYISGIYSRNEYRIQYCRNVCINYNINNILYYVIPCWRRTLNVMSLRFGFSQTQPPTHPPPPRTRPNTPLGRSNSDTSRQFNSYRPRFLAYILIIRS